MEASTHHPPNAAPKSESECAQGIQAGSHNISSTERMISVGLGGALLVAGLRHLNSIPGIALAAAGGALVQRGASGFCALYHALGIDTSDHQSPTNASRREKPAGAYFIDTPEERAAKHRTANQMIDDESAASFPASDPPSWNSSTLG